MEDNKTTAWAPMDPTEHNIKMREQSMLDKKQETLSNIGTLEKLLIEQTEPNSLVRLMDIVENVIQVCGGESKLQFIEVTRDSITVKTRIPVTANIFPFISEEKDNPRFHKVITKVLLLIKEIEGVRWVPTEDRQSHIVISLNRPEHHT